MLRFHKNKYTVNGQLESHVDEHSDLRTLRELELSKFLKKYAREELASDVRKEVILVSTYFARFVIIFRNR